MLFPQERPEYPAGAPAGDYARIRLETGETWVTATTVLHLGAKRCLGVSRAKTAELTTDSLARDRVCQRIIKLSFYKAAVAMTGQHPDWGALTGIRPVKIATRLLEQGQSPKQAARILEKTYFLSPVRAKLCVDTAITGARPLVGLDPFRDISIYVGIPFCPTRCGYCSFVSNSVEKSMHLVRPYLDALLLEIEKAGEIVAELGLRPVSLYIGGGTPTTLDAGQLTELMEKLRACLPLEALREYTVEAGRPDTITADKLLAIKNGGADRVSINPQTMSDGVLEAIGRRHTAAETVAAYRLAREVGFACINMDLIAGLPKDTPAGFRRSLDQVLDLDPENVTVHTLALKKGAKLMLEPQALPGPAEVGAMLDYVLERLPGAGYQPYYLYRQKFMSGGFENVGWAKSGRESLYNICIMEEVHTILSLGGGAVTKLVNPATGRIERIINPKYPKEYVERICQVIANKDGVSAFYRREPGLARKNDEYL